jgi:hypothetical protein
MDPKKLKQMSIMQLSKWQAGYIPESHHYILAENEWRRRGLQKQHELNSQIIEKQHELNLGITKIQSKTQWRSTMFGALCAILGAIAGAYLTVTLSEHLSKKQPPPTSPIKQESVQSQTLTKKPLTPMPREKNENEESQNALKKKNLSPQAPNESNK